MNCIVQKLPITIENNDFHKLGYLRIIIEKQPNVDLDVLTINLQFSQESKIIIYNNYFTSSNGLENFGNILTSDTTLYPIYIPYETCYIDIEKTYLQRLGTIDPNISAIRRGITIVLDELKNLSSLQMLTLNQSNLIGDIKNTPPNLTLYDVTNTKLVGDIANLENLNNMTYVGLENNNVYGDASVFENKTRLTHLNLYSTKITGSLNSFSNLTALTYLTLTNTEITGDLSALRDLTNLTTLSIPKNITGNISDLSRLTNLTGTLDLHYSPNINGELGSVSGLTNLTYLYFTGTKISGNIESLHNLTKLTNISLGNCECRGDIASLKYLPVLTFFSCVGEKNEIYGNLATLPASMREIRAGANSLFSWSSMSRPTNANAFSMTGIRFSDNTNDLDNMLQNMALCQPLPNGGIISVYGTRTGASDGAIAQLQANHYQIHINDEEV